MKVFRLFWWSQFDFLIVLRVTTKSLEPIVRVLLPWLWWTFACLNHNLPNNTEYDSCPSSIFKIVVKIFYEHPTVSIFKFWINLMGYTLCLLTICTMKGASWGLLNSWASFSIKMMLILDPPSNNKSFTPNLPTLTSTTGMALSKSYALVVMTL